MRRMIRRNERKNKNERKIFSNRKKCVKVEADEKNLPNDVMSLK